MSINQGIFNRTIAASYSFLVIGITVVVAILFLFHQMSVLYSDFNKLQKENNSSKEETFMNENLLNKKIAMVISFRDFKDIEYFIPRNIFINKKAKVLTVSSKKGIAIGNDGGEANVDIEASEFKVETFDAVVFIGGSGMSKKLDDAEFQRIVKDAVENDKVLGAICIAPALLAKAGVLNGKEATVWSSYLDKEPVNILRRNGAIYKEESVVVDGKIITANGPEAAKEWAGTLIGVIASQ